MKVSIAIAVQDKGAPRSNTGDIIAVEPSGWQWGTEEVKRFLILELDLGNTIVDIDKAQKLTVPQFATGERWWPEENPDGTLSVTITGKRRYHLPLAKLNSIATANGVTLDWTKLRDIKQEYQPLKAIAINPVANVRDKVLGSNLTAAHLRAIRDT